MFKKFIAFFVILAVFATMFVGCGEEKKTPEADLEDISNALDDLTDALVSTEDPTVATSPVNTDLSKSEACAYQLVHDLQQGDYAAAMSCLNIEDTTFITAENLEWYIPRSDYKNVVDSVGEITVVSSEGGNTIDRVLVSVGGNTVSVDTFLNDDNEWKAVIGGFYIGDWSIKVPGDSVVYINDVEVPKTMKTGTEDLQDLYTLPAVPNKVLSVKITGPVFGDVVKEVLPVFSNEPTPVWVSPASEDSDTLFSLLKDMLNAIHEDYEAGKTPAELSKYISSMADPQLAQRVWDSIHECYTWNSGLDPTNIRYTTVKGSPTVDNIDVFIAKYRTNNILLLNVAVEKTWDEKYSSSDSTRVLGTIFVEYVDGQLYIYDLPGDNFLTERNDFIQNW